MRLLASTHVERLRREVERPRHVERVDGSSQVRPLLRDALAAYARNGEPIRRRWSPEETDLIWLGILGESDRGDLEWTSEVLKTFAGYL